MVNGVVAPARLGEGVPGAWYADSDGAAARAVVEESTTAERPAMATATAVAAIRPRRATPRTLWLSRGLDRLDMAANVTSM